MAEAEKTPEELAFLLVVGQRIAEQRDAKGLSQEELADRSHLHRTHMGPLERGEVEMGTLTVRQIAHGLGIDPGDLLDGIGP